MNCLMGASCFMWLQKQTNAMHAYENHMIRHLLCYDILYFISDWTLEFHVASSHTHTLNEFSYKTYLVFIFFSLRNSWVSSPHT